MSILNTFCYGMICKPMDCFPLDLEPRDKQIKILEFIDRALERGYKDIIISAPTGCGKTGIGMAMSFWGAVNTAENCESGGYYLVTQKILQDQIERDFQRFKQRYNNQSASIMSSTEYPCARHGNCKLGSSSKPRCAQIKAGGCSYALARSKFSSANLSVTNYPYFLSSASLPPRTVVVCDETHTVESQLLRFVEFTVTRKSLEEWAPHLVPPKFKDNVYDFIDWVSQKYAPAIANRLEMIEQNLERDPHNRAWQRDYNAYTAQLNKAKVAIEEFRADEKKWVFWQEKNDDCMLKPLDADAYFPMIKDQAAVRIYMSAYVGPSDIFCRSLGLNVNDVAHGKFSSTFPVDNRPIYMNTVGSMSMANIQVTLPNLLDECETILDHHKGDKGIIHCHSYRLGALIYEHLMESRHAARILFPHNSHLRKEQLSRHIESSEPTVLLSPSMAEGFSLDDDQARFQIITKMPYPYLGDRQVRAKMDIDRDWYTLETVKVFIQACGRIVRSESDYGDTYMLDSDFLKVFDKNPEFFPGWFTDAFQWK